MLRYKNTTNLSELQKYFSSGEQSIDTHDFDGLFRLVLA